MDLIDLTTTPVEDKHQVIIEKIKALKPGQVLKVKSEQDLIVLQSHIVDEFGDTFSWKHLQNEEDTFELIVEKNNR